MARVSRAPRPAAARRWQASARESRPIGLYDALCVALCTVSALFAISGPLGRWVWICDVLNLFRPYALVASVLALLACLVGRRAGVIALAATLVLAEALLLTLPMLRHDGLGRGAGGGRELKVITFNCLGTNPNAATAIAWMRQARPDILILEEVPQDWRGPLGSLSDILPGRASQLQPERSDTDIFSRAPMTAADAYQPSSDLRRLIHVTLQYPSGPVQVFGLHPNTLQTPQEWRHRNEALELAGQWIAQTRGSGPAIAAGDWNTPPWSPYFHRFLRLAGLRVADPLVWPPMTRVLASPGGVRIGSSIDHVAGSRGLRVIGCETGPQLGSDHAPQICRLALKPDGPAG